MRTTLALFTVICISVISLASADLATNPINLGIEIRGVAATTGTGHCLRVEDKKFVAFVGTEIDLTKYHTIAASSNLAATSWFRIKSGAELVELINPGNACGGPTMTSPGKIKAKDPGDIVLEAVVTFSGRYAYDQVTISFVKLDTFTVTGEKESKSDSSDSYGDPSDNKVRVLEDKNGKASVTFNATLNPAAWSSYQPLLAYIKWGITDDSDHGWSPNRGNMQTPASPPPIVVAAISSSPTLMSAMGAGAGSGSGSPSIGSKWTNPKIDADRKANVTCFYDRNEDNVPGTEGETPRRIEIVPVLVTPNMNKPHRVGITVGEHNRTQNLTAKVEPSDESKNVTPVAQNAKVTVALTSNANSPITFTLVGVTKSGTQGDTGVNFNHTKLGLCITATVSVIVPNKIKTPHQKFPKQVVQGKNILINDETSPSWPSVSPPNVSRVSFYGTILTVVVVDQFDALCGDLYNGAIITENGGLLLVNQTLTSTSAYQDPVGAVFPKDGQNGSVAPDSPEARSWPTDPVIQSPNSGSIDLSREVEVDGMSLEGGTGERTLIFTSPSSIEVKWP